MTWSRTGPDTLKKYIFIQNDPFYLHPRDFAPDCPRVPMPLKRRFKCYVVLDTTRGKLDNLLANFQWAACETILGLDSPSTEAAA